MSSHDNDTTIEQTIHVQPAAESPPSNAKPSRFPCPQCDATFNRSAHLRRHQTTHRGEKPHGCPYCSVASTRKDVIIRHIRNFHPDVASTARPSSVSEARRRVNSISSPPGLDAVRSASRRASHSGVAAVVQDEDRRSEEPDASGHQNEPSGSLTDEDNSAGRNGRAGWPDPCSLSLTGPLHGYLQDNTLAFPDSFVEPGIVDDDFGDMMDVDMGLGMGMDMDLFISNAQHFMPGIATGGAGQSPASRNLSSPTSSSPDGDGSNYGHGGSARLMSVSDDDDLTKAQAKVAAYPKHLLGSLRFPSKYASRRFIVVFFKYLAPHIPIVHQPTFSIATAPAPLLLACMACGATYLGEHAIAASLYSAAMQLVFEHDRVTLPGKADGKARLWMLQVSLLLSYLGLHCGMEHWAAYAYPHSIKCATDALADIKASPVTTYREWVHQESIIRCLSVTLLIAAAPGSGEKEHCFIAPVVDGRFPLPSSTADWLRDEASWKPPTKVLFFDDAMKTVLAGRIPDETVSEFGMVTIVAAVLYRVTSFEALTSSLHNDLYTDFVGKMDSTTQALDEMLKHRIDQGEPGLMPEPAVHCAKSLLNSLFYHLYGSTVLAKLKRSLYSPTVPSDSERIPRVADEATSPFLHKALLRAAEQLRFDCQLGLRYLRRVAVQDFGPECAISSYEGGLLLYWYLESSQPLVPHPQLRDTLRAMIDESFAEVEELQVQLQGHVAAIPLAFASELLNDASVWHWPASVSRKLARLTERVMEGVRDRSTAVAGQCH